MRIFFYSLAACMLLSLIAACSTSEKNYRQAYERTIAGDSTHTALENTIYGKQRLDVRVTDVTDGTDTVTASIVRVSVTPDGGGIRENLKKYCVVVAEFKQLFNAKSLRERLVDNGYPGAFIVQTSEPFYYVLALSTSQLAQANSTLRKINSNPPFKLTSKPYILIPSRLQ